MSDSLFEAVSRGQNAPLADRMRPRSLDEYIGQQHIVGHGRLLRRAIQRDRLSSLILSGPPGTGKTTLARVIANATEARFIAINAVLCGVQAIRDTIEAAKKERELYSRRTILFVDEVHRWNKAQQDALLPWVENGTVILIGATTENPFFEVNKALVSRSRVFQLCSLSEEDLLQAARQALADIERGYGRWQVSFDDGALEHLVKTAGGDARALLNALELAIETCADTWPLPDGSAIRISLDTAEQSIQKRAVLYDKDGDAHYDTISAFIKSIRGSDADASLYWLARMIYAGEDPSFILRRLLISAAEDIGLADPNAVIVVQACASAFDRLGLPEGQFLLAEACLYLANAPKSNSAMAYFDALAAVERELAEVPNHLKDGSRDAQGLGHGAGYNYPHAYRGHWVNQQYLPDSLKGLVFYRPGRLGFEAAIYDQVVQRRDVQLAAMESQQDQSLPSRSLNQTSSQAWRQRSSTGLNQALQQMQQDLLKIAGLKRHENVLVLNAADGILTRAAFRATPEGSLTAVLKSRTELDRFNWQYADTEDILKPTGLLAENLSDQKLAQYCREQLGHGNVDCLMGLDFLAAAQAEAGPFLTAWRTAFPVARLVSAEKLPPKCGIISALLDRDIPEDLRQRFRAADDEFYDGEHRRNLELIRLALQTANFTLTDSQLLDTVIQRQLSESELRAWFEGNGAWANQLRTALSDGELRQILEALVIKLDKCWVNWPRCWLLVKAMPVTSQSGT